MVSEGQKNWPKKPSLQCLNPCFSGGWSQSAGALAQQRQTKSVLILVLVEDGLRAEIDARIAQIEEGLNPCFSGGWSQREKPERE